MIKFKSKNVGIFRKFMEFMKMDDFGLFRQLVDELNWMKEKKFYKCIKKHITTSKLVILRSRLASYHDFQNTFISENQCSVLISAHALQFVVLMPDVRSSSANLSLISAFEPERPNASNPITVTYITP